MILPAILLLAAAGAGDSGQFTVQPRSMETQHTIHLDVGPVWLSRFDLLESPGLQLDATWYLDGSFALDIARVTAFYTFEPQATQDVRQATGYRPTSQWPRLHLAAGVRYGFAYGKMLIEHTETVLHFIPEVGAHLGVLWTDGGWNPTVDLSLHLRVQLSGRWELCAGVTVMGSPEGDRAPFVVGIMPSLLAGVSF